MNVKKCFMIKKYIRLWKLKIPRNFFIFFIILAITSVVWVLNSLNNEYSTTIDIPIDYNFPNNLANSTDLPSKFSVTIKGFGYNILKTNFINRFSKYIFDFSSLKSYLKNNNKNNQYILETNKIRKVVQSSYFNDLVSIENIKPDTIFFKLTKVTEKIVKIKINANIKTKEQYVVFGQYEIKPDKIKIYGAKEILDSLDYVESEYFELNDVYQSKTIELPLKEIKGVKFQYKSVEVKFQVEEYTEIQIDKDIILLNVPDSLVLNIMPQKCFVRYKVPLRFVSIVNTNSINLYVDYKKIDPIGSKIEVEHDSLPSHIIGISVIPEYVDYFIENKN